MENERHTFEERLNRVEKIVEKMEGENLSMEEALSLFEEGKTLVRSLENELKEAKEKMAELTNKQ